MDSDHFLLKVIIKQRFLKICKEKTIQTNKWNKANLQNPTKRRQYGTSLQKRLKILPNTINDEECWKRIKVAITEASKHQMKPYTNKIEPQGMDGGMKNVGNL
jgi:hypothetical protein